MKRYDPTLLVTIAALVVWGGLFIQNENMI